MVRFRELISASGAKNSGALHFKGLAEFISKLNIIHLLVNHVKSDEKNDEMCRYPISGHWPWCPILAVYIKQLTGRIQINCSIFLTSIPL